MDLGRAGEEPFLLMAGIGWDAQIANTVTAPLKRQLGVFAYVLHGVPMLHRLRTTDVAWATEGESVEEQVGLIVVSNTRLYGGILMFSPEASARDGQLDACIFTPRHAPEAASPCAQGGGAAASRGRGHTRAANAALRGDDSGPARAARRRRGRRNANDANGRTGSAPDERAGRGRCRRRCAPRVATRPRSG